MKHSFPNLTSNKKTAEFLEQDLTEYLDPQYFQPVRFEFLAKTEKVNLRISAPLLAAIKKRAKKASMPYQRYIRQVLERELTRPEG